MAHSAEELSSSGELDPLRDALESAFLSPDDSLREVPAPPASGPSTGGGASGETPLPAQDSTAPEPPVDDAWRAEYDERLAQWRAEAAVARQRAEEERARWAAVRDAEHAALETRRLEERQRAEVLEASQTTDSWESVRQSTVSVVSSQAAGASEQAGARAEAHTRERLGGARVAVQLGTEHEPPSEEGLPSVADARDLTTSEAEGSVHMMESMHSDFPSVISMGSTPPTIPSGFPTDTDSAVEVSNGEERVSRDADAEESSLNESQPSRRRTGPSRSTPAAPVGGLPEARPFETKESAPPVSVPQSLTLSVFAPDLPWRTRFLALLSTLAINLALPFINGVMLGFGEIFARNYIAVWIGWTKRPKNSATAVGIRF